MKQELLDGHSQMRKDIAKAKDKYLKDIWIYIRDNMEKVPKEDFLNHIQEMILESLEETYSITSAAARKLYNIKAERLKDGEIEELIYSKDGKELYRRLEEHYDNAVERDNPSEYFRNRIILIVDTETLTVSNAVLHGKLNKKAKYVEVIGEADCWEENGGLCEYWISQGKIPINELTELPPYHPDCECMVIYYL